MTEYTGYGQQGYDADAEGNNSSFDGSFYTRNNPNVLAQQMGDIFTNQLEAAYDNAVANIFHKNEHGHAVINRRKIGQPIEETPSYVIAGTSKPPVGMEIRAVPEGSRHSVNGIYTIQSMPNSN